MVIKYHDQVDHNNAESNPPSGFRIFVGRVVHSKSLHELECLRHAAVGITPDGTIAFVRHRHHDEMLDQPLRDLHPDFTHADIIKLQPSQFLFPGMIDTHLHAPQWPNLALGMEGELKEWCEEWTDPMEASYSDTTKATRVYADVVRTTLQLGSTTVAYNSTIHAAATNILSSTCFRLGQRAIIGKMCITINSTHHNHEASPEQSLADSESSIRHILSLDPTGRLLHPCVQPRGGPFCPPALMHALGQQRRKYDARTQCHMCEAPSDIARMRDVHGAHVSSYSAMYAAHDLLTRGILAHCIHLLPEDLRNLRAAGAGVAHNPNSNTCLRDGECRVRDLLDHGVKVGLGTDCSAGYMPSISDAMRNASNVSRHLAVHTGEERYVLGFSELVYLATRGGAEVVGLEEVVGGFDVGKKFDALVVDVRGVVSADASLWDGEEDRTEWMVKKWVFLGDDRHIRKVFVDGRLVAGADLV